MFNVREVFDILKQYTDISEDEKETAMGLCSNALEDIRSHLKPEADPEDRRIITAAGAQAFYMLCIKKSAPPDDGMTSFKAGDLSLTYSRQNYQQQAQLAKELAQQAMRQLAGLIEDGGFYFGKVDI